MGRRRAGDGNRTGDKFTFVNACSSSGKKDKLKTIDQRALIVNRDFAKGSGMKKVHFVWTLWMVAMVAGGCGQQLDFQKILSNAKSRVYPTLVFVKPIRETFSSGERQRAEVFGSGVIISQDGYVVTNNHVAEKAIEINCVLGDREQIPATVVGLDPETDLALLKLKLPEDHAPLEVAPLGDSDNVASGQFVMALGSPFGFTRSISLGIISNTERYLGFSSEHRYNLWFQTDAAINPGNSGGPLVNTEGEVIGINTLGTWAENIGFSIPVNVVKDIIQRLKTQAADTDEDKWPVKVRRAYTGLQLQALNDFQTNTFTDSKCGVLVRSVDKDSPAARAGVKDGDILLAVGSEGGAGILSQSARVNGLYVEDLPAIRVMLADLPLDKPTTLLLARKGVEREKPENDHRVLEITPRSVFPADKVGGRGLVKVKITPTVRGKFEGEDFDCKRWNMTVKEITKFSNPRLHFLHGGGGVFIQGVRQPGNAADAGLQVNDVLVEIGEHKIKNLDDVEKAYEQLLKAKKDKEKKVLITIKRGRFIQWKTLDWTKDYLKED